MDASCGTVSSCSLILSAVFNFGFWNRCLKPQFVVSEAKGYKGHKQSVLYFARVAMGMLYHAAFCIMCSYP